jgi:hypothetical protein
LHTRQQVSSQPVSVVAFTPIFSERIDGLERTFF